MQMLLDHTIKFEDTTLSACPAYIGNLPGIAILDTESRKTKFFLSMSMMPGLIKFYEKHKANQKNFDEALPSLLENLREVEKDYE
jgi:hypothetical protein